MDLLVGIVSAALVIGRMEQLN